jgi:hypothetical protein
MARSGKNIDIIFPRPGQVIHNKVFTVVFSLAEEFDNYLLFLDDMAVPEESSRSLFVESLDEKNIFRRVVVQSPGAHKLTIIGQKGSESSTVDIDFKYIDTQKAKGKTHAIIVGVSEYQSADVRNLRYAADDAWLFYQYLTTAKKNPVAPDNIQLMLDEQATNEAISAAFESLYEKISHEDNLYIFFAGHGYFSNFGGYLIPYDFEKGKPYFNSACSYSLIRQVIDTVSPHNSVLLLDSCHAGFSSEIKSDVSSFQERALKNLALSRTVVLSSCRAAEKSYEDEQFKHGLFSYFLVKGLSGKASRRSGNRTSVYELYDYIIRNVEEACSPKCFDQHPTMVGNAADDFFFTEGDVAFDEITKRRLKKVSPKRDFAEEDVDVCDETKFKQDEGKETPESHEKIGKVEIKEELKPSPLSSEHQRLIEKTRETLSRSDNKEMEGLLQSLEKDYGKDKNFHLLTGLYDFNQGKLVAAKHHFEACLKKEKDNPEALEGLENTKQRIQFLSMVLRTRMRRAQSFESKGRKKEALDICKELFEIATSLDDKEKADTFRKMLSRLGDASTDMPPKSAPPGKTMIGPPPTSRSGKSGRYGVYQPGLDEGKHSPATMDSQSQLNDGPNGALLETSKDLPKFSEAGFGKSVGPPKPMRRKLKTSASNFMQTAVPPTSKKLKDEKESSDNPAMPPQLTKTVAPPVPRRWQKSSSSAVGEYKTATPSTPSYAEPIITALPTDASPGDTPSMSESPHTGDDFMRKRAPGPKLKSRTIPESEPEDAESEPESRFEPGPDNELMEEPESDSSSDSDPSLETEVESEFETKPDSGSDFEFEDTFEPECDSELDNELEQVFEPEAEFDSESESIQETEPESDPEPEIDSEQEPDTETRPEEDLESEQEPETEIEIKPESGLEPESDSVTKLMQEPEPELESESEPEPEAEPELELDAEAESHLESEPEPERAPEAELDSESESIQETEPESETEPKSEPEPEIDSEPEPDTEPKPEEDLESEPEPETEIEIKSESGLGQESEPAPELLEIPESDLQPKPELEPDLESESVSEVEAEIETKSESGGERETELVPESPVELESNLELEHEPKPDVELKLETEPETQSASESESDPEPELKPEPEIDSGPDADREVEPVLEQGTDSESESGPESTTGLEEKLEPDPESVPIQEAEPELEPESEAELELDADAESQLETEPEAEHAPEADPEPEFESMQMTKHESEPGPKTDSEPEPGTETKLDEDLESEPGSETEIEIKSESGLELESESEPEVEAKADPEFEPIQEAEPDSEPAPEGDSELTPTTEMKSEIELDSEPGVKAELDSATKAMQETGPELDPGPETDSEPEPESEAKSEEELDSESGSEIDSELERGPKAVLDSGVESESLSESDADSKSEPMEEPEAELGSETEPEPEADPELESELEPEPETDSKPGQDTETKLEEDLGTEPVFEPESEIGPEIEIAFDQAPMAVEAPSSLKIDHSVMTVEQLLESGRLIGRSNKQNDSATTIDIDTESAIPPPVDVPDLLSDSRLEKDQSLAEYVNPPGDESAHAKEQSSQDIPAPFVSDKGNLDATDQEVSDVDDENADPSLLRTSMDIPAPPDTLPSVAQKVSKTPQDIPAPPDTLSSAAQKVSKTPQDIPAPPTTKFIQPGRAIKKEPARHSVSQTEALKDAATSGRKRVAKNTRWVLALLVVLGAIFVAAYFLSSTDQLPATTKPINTPAPLPTVAPPQPTAIQEPTPNPIPSVEPPPDPTPKPKISIKKTNKKPKQKTIASPPGKKPQPSTAQPLLTPKSPVNPEDLKSDSESGAEENGDAAKTDGATPPDLPNETKATPTPSPKPTPEPTPTSTSGEVDPSELL